MGAFFSVGNVVTITKKSPVPVAGDSGDHTGKTGRVRGYVDLAAEDILHVVELGNWGPKGWEPKPLFVPDGTANLPEYGPTGPTGRKIHGDTLPDHKVEWLEVPGSCLS